VWVAVSDLETSVYGGLPQFEFVVLVSDRNQSGMIAVVQLAQQSHVPKSTVNPRGVKVSDVVKAQLLAVLQAAGKEAGKEWYEIPQGIVVETKRWTETEVLPGGGSGVSDRAMHVALGQQKMHSFDYFVHFVFTSLFLFHLLAMKRPSAPTVTALS
jgi:hypothetical protein